jgi:hypothetical protein
LVHFFSTALPGFFTPILPFQCYPCLEPKALPMS